MSRRAETPRLAFPFRLDAGRPAVAEQDSPEDVGGCAALVLSYPLDFRPELPEFGLADLVHRQGGAGATGLAEDVTAALEEWEPRARALAEEDPAVLDQALRRVRVDLRVGEDAPPPGGAP